MLIDFGVLISTFRIGHLPVPIPLVPHDVPTDLAHAESGAGANDLKTPGQVRSLWVHPDRSDMVR